MDTKNSLSWLTLFLHWIIAFTIIGLIGLGLVMTNFEQYHYYDIHKSIGIILIGFILLRVLWRIKQGWPVPVSKYDKREMLMAKIVHWVLIVSTVLMPITGMLFSGASGHGFGIFGLEILHENTDPADPENVIPLNRFLGGFGEVSHEYLGYLLILAIVLHIAGALKHHLIYKDPTLLRMLGKKL
ncbi:cytochrome b [Methylomonas methanica]|uniref:Cytochrome b561, putative n=1 Tax=Methylomonas methanica (strain DSM 25384 / MC09) TaxID=857087 RepID=G0A2U0_METMM|nr:cytochrome b [Methylomonas methanica]AEG01443.1 cytochrome b561, putative [Methylomonas methanica MC09]